MILLDTHVVLWLLGNPERLSAAATQAIEKAWREGGLGVSAMTLFEAATAVTRRRVEIDKTAEALLAEIELWCVVKPISAPVAIASARFSEPYPRDPMDRLIGATALVEGIPLVTADARIRQSGQLQTIW